MISSSWQWQGRDASSYLVMPSSPSCNDPMGKKEIDLKDLASTQNDPLSIFLFPIWCFLCFVLSTFTTFLLGRMGASYTTRKYWIAPRTFHIEKEAANMTFFIIIYPPLFLDCDGVFAFMEFGISLSQRVYLDCWCRIFDSLPCCREDIVFPAIVYNSKLVKSEKKNTCTKVFDMRK